MRIWEIINFIGSSDFGIDLLTSYNGIVFHVINTQLKSKIADVQSLCTIDLS